MNAWYLGQEQFELAKDELSYVKLYERKKPAEFMGEYLHPLPRERD